MMKTALDMPDQGEKEPQPHIAAGLIDDMQGDPPLTPYIIFAPEKLIIDSSLQSNIVIEKETTSSTTYREFKQNLVIDIYDTNLALIEKWAAITTCLFLIDSKAIIDAANKDLETSRYSAGGFEASPFFSMINFIKAEPIKYRDFFKIRLEYDVKGSLRLTKNIAEDMYTIKTVDVAI